MPDAMSQLLQLSAAQVVGVLSIIWLYRGARAVRAGFPGRGPLLEIAAGGLACVLYGAASYWMAATTSELVEPPAHRTKFHEPLPADWGSQLAPQERESASLAYVSAVFRDSGRILKFVDTTGAWRDYCPSAEDAAQLKEWAENNARLRASASGSRSVAYQWWVAGVIALLFGAVAGRRGNERKR